MKQNDPSITAYKAAVMRAAHQLLDNPKAFEDPVVLRLIGDKGVSDIHSKARKFNRGLQKGLRMGIIARRRAAESCLIT